jgi:hypothetical protein
VAAAVVSIHQAKTAEDSARAQEQVVAAKEANQLTSRGGAGVPA